MLLEINDLFKIETNCDLKISDEFLPHGWKNEALEIKWALW